MTHEATFENDRAEPTPIKSRWQENHGNLLMAFVGVIFLIGSSVLIYRQTRFVPPRFPESGMIAVPDAESSNSPLVSEAGLDDVVMIRVTGAANDFGAVRIAIYEDEESFNSPDLAIVTESVSLEGGEAVWNVPIVGLPRRIAIAAYHDENNDQQLSLNRFGIPSERYGFSNNARGLTGPPTFQQTLIDLPRGGETLNLFIR